MGHLWLRNEYKKFERRSPLTPQHAQSLVELGHIVVVEESPLRAFSIEEYKNAGCEIAPSGAWESAPYNAYILGLKNLPELFHPLRHKHIYFAHSFKAQLHSKWLLRRFRKGGGILYDLEYLIDNEGKRVAAFGFYAGVVGAAIALMIWAMKKRGIKPPYKIPNLYMSQSKMIQDIRESLNALNIKPSILLIGAKGRSGLGAMNLIKQLGLEAEYWGREDTKRNNISQAILNYDILLNCVFVDQNTPCFLTENDLMKNDKRLSVISDISCEPDSKYNPLPFYTETTSFENPTQSIREVDLISIDNLPSYLPVESSMHFSEQLIPHLQGLLDEKIDYSAWSKAKETFCEYSMNYIIENKVFNNYENSNTKKYYRCG
jgi:alanine dehydrogenase